MTLQVLPEPAAVRLAKPGLAGTHAVDEVPVRAPMPLLARHDRAPVHRPGHVASQHLAEGGPSAGPAHAGPRHCGCRHSRPHARHPIGAPWHLVSAHGVDRTAASAGAHPWIILLRPLRPRTPFGSVDAKESDGLKHGAESGRGLEPLAASDAQPGSSPALLAGSVPVTTENPSAVRGFSESVGGYGATRREPAR